MGTISFSFEDVFRLGTFLGTVFAIVIGILNRLDTAAKRAEDRRNRVDDKRDDERDDTIADLRERNKLLLQDRADRDATIAQLRIDLTSARGRGDYYESRFRETQHPGDD